MTHTRNPQAELAGKQARNGPNIHVLPPVVYVSAILLGVGLQQVWPMPLSPWAATRWLGVALGGLSVAGALWAVGEFRRWKTPFRVDRPATSLVQSGPFRYSRNPAYVALSAAQLGIAMFFNIAWILATLVPAIIVISRAVIAKEERYLERNFGAEYRQYMGTVRRWL